MTTATIDPPKVEASISVDGDSTTTTYTDGSFVTTYDDGMTIKGQRHEDDESPFAHEPPAVTEPNANRIAYLREQILDDIRAQALPAFERMQAASMTEGDNIARCFLANLCGQFDYLARVEKGEL